ncbi:MAG: 30S ribosome-binding factor RbfA [Negativibacillus sp.]|nr:30S ribosome-binding factor RbfA [Negativibacillus sp.]
MAFRVGRTSEDLKRELTDIIRHVKDPRVSSILTIIKVELSNDMSHCKVYVSSLDGLDKAKQAVEGLNNANGFIKHEVNARIKMRRIPDFHFIADDSTEYSADIARILNSLDIKKDEPQTEEE